MGNHAQQRTTGWSPNWTDARRTQPFVRGEPALPVEPPGCPYLEYFTHPPCVFWAAGTSKFPSVESIKSVLPYLWEKQNTITISQSPGWHYWSCYFVSNLVRGKNPKIFQLQWCTREKRAFAKLKPANLCLKSDFKESWSYKLVPNIICSVTDWLIHSPFELYIWVLCYRFWRNCIVSCLIKETQTSRQELLLTCMFVCELDEAVGDVSPSVETNHLGLHIPTGRLKQRAEGVGLTERGGDTSPHKPLISQETPGSFCVLVKLCCYDRLTRAATALLITWLIDCLAV